MVHVAISAIRELGSAGEIIGKQGPNGQKHSVEQLSSRGTRWRDESDNMDVDPSFCLPDCNDPSIVSVDANVAKFSHAPFDDSIEISVTLYGIEADSSTFTLGETDSVVADGVCDAGEDCETWTLEEGDFKFDIDVVNWEFLDGDEQWNKKGEVGAYLQIELELSQPNSDTADFEGNLDIIGMDYETSNMASTNGGGYTAFANDGIAGVRNNYQNRLAVTTVTFTRPGSGSTHDFRYDPIVKPVQDTIKQLFWDAAPPLRPQSGIVNPFDVSGKTKTGMLVALSVVGGVLFVALLGAAVFYRDTITARVKGQGRAEKAAEKQTNEPTLTDLNKLAEEAKPSKPKPTINIRRSDPPALPTKGADAAVSNAGPAIVTACEV